MTDKEVSTWGGNRFTNNLYYEYQHETPKENRHETISPRIRESLRRPASVREHSMGDLSEG
jgi:hypothetical protein